MEIILVIVAGAAIVYVGYRMLNASKSDGSHPLDAATQAPYKIEPKTTVPDGIGHESITVQPVISNVLDVNKDGKVDIEDVKEVVKKTKTKAKKVAAEVTEKVKKVKKKKAE